MRSRADRRGRTDASAFSPAVIPSSQCALRACLPVRSASNTVDGGDQRFMAVDALALGAAGWLAAVGNSQGSVELYAVDGALALSRVFSSVVHATPVLCVRFCVVEEAFLLVAGTAAGDLVVVNCNEEVAAITGRALPVPAQKTWVFPEVHVMGVNDLAVRRAGDCVTCVSVGDDQTARVTVLRVADQTVVCEAKTTLPAVSGTSVRGVTWVGDDVFLTGWEQTVQRWSWRENALQFVGKVDVQVPETGCIDVAACGERVWGSVCGAMGFEVFDLSI